MNEINAFIKKTSESFLAPTSMGGHSKKTAIYEPESEPSPAIESASALLLDFQPPELQEIISVVYKPLSW